MVSDDRKPLNKVKAKKKTQFQSKDRATISQNVT